MNDWKIMVEKEKLKEAIENGSLRFFQTFVGSWLLIVFGIAGLINNFPIDLVISCFVLGIMMSILFLRFRMETIVWSNRAIMLKFVK